MGIWSIINMIDWTRKTILRNRLEQSQSQYNLSVTYLNTHKHISIKAVTKLKSNSLFIFKNNNFKVGFRSNCCSLLCLKLCYSFNSWYICCCYSNHSRLDVVVFMDVAAAAAVGGLAGRLAGWHGKISHHNSSSSQ